MVQNPTNKEAPALLTSLYDALLRRTAPKIRRARPIGVRFPRDPIWSAPSGLLGRIRVQSQEGALSSAECGLKYNNKRKVKSCEVWDFCLVSAGGLSPVAWDSFAWSLGGKRGCPAWSVQEELSSIGWNCFSIPASCVPTRFCPKLCVRSPLGSRPQGQKRSSLAGDAAPEIKSKAGI